MGGDTFLTPVGVDPFSLHAGPLQPPPWPPCKLPADEGSRTPPGSSLANVGVDETATPIPRIRAATPVASVLLNLTFMGHLPKFAVRRFGLTVLTAKRWPNRADEFALIRRRSILSRLRQRVVHPIIPWIYRASGLFDLRRPTPFRMKPRRAEKNQRTGVIAIEYLAGLEPSGSRI